jgi:hypothetical protein
MEHDLFQSLQEDDGFYAGIPTGVGVRDLLKKSLEKKASRMTAQRIADTPESGRDDEKSFFCSELHRPGKVE